MIDIKTKEEIEIMVQGGRILAEVVDKVLQRIAPGVSEIELDQLAEKIILDKGAEPAFKKVEGYNYTLCISTNEAVVHGIPGEYRFKEGDVVGIDCGVFYKGFYTDMSESIEVKSQKSKVKSQEIQEFLETGKRALDEAIKVAKPGNRVGNISETIQSIVEEAGYSIVRSLVGHGVGKKLHEEPEVPGFLDRPINKTPLLKEGMTIAIEVIYNMGKSDVEYEGEWRVITKDRLPSGLFEKTVAITNKEPLIITK